LAEELGKRRAKLNGLIWRRGGLRVSQLRALSLNKVNKGNKPWTIADTTMSTASESGSLPLRPALRPEEMSPKSGPVKGKLPTWGSFELPRISSSKFSFYSKARDLLLTSFSRLNCRARRNTTLPSRRPRTCETIPREHFKQTNDRPSPHAFEQFLKTLTREHKQHGRTIYVVRCGKYTT
jgi:hypothetical protein